MAKGLSTRMVWLSQATEAEMSGRVSTPVTSIRAPAVETGPSGVLTETRPVSKTPAAEGVTR